MRKIITTTNIKNAHGKDNYLKSINIMMPKGKKLILGTLYDSEIDEFSILILSLRINSYLDTNGKINLNTLKTLKLKLAKPQKTIGIGTRKAIYIMLK